MSQAGLFLRLLARTFWSRALVFWLAGAFLVVAFGSWIGARTGASNATDRVLLGLVFGWVIPISTYAVFQCVTHARRLDRAAEVVARHGVSRRLAVLIAGCAIAFFLAITCALLSALAVAFSREPSDPALAKDLFASASIGAFAGATYGSWLSLGSTLGARGGARLWFLALDFLLGSSSGPSGVLFPRAHLKNLLGGEPPLGLSQGASGAVLLVSALITLLLATRRTPD